MGKPRTVDRHCPECKLEAVALKSGKNEVVWCSGGHVTVVDIAISHPDGYELVWDFRTGGVLRQ